MKKWKNGYMSPFAGIGIAIPALAIAKLFRTRDLLTQNQKPNE
jgi:hypothetical protein